VTAAAAADVGDLVLVGVDAFEVANVEAEELAVVLGELVVLALLDVDEAVLEASDASIEVTSVYTETATDTREPSGSPCAATLEVSNSKTVLLVSKDDMAW
jgi:hypothetical protein